MFEEVNLILSEWDPIGVGSPISIYEYKQYVPTLIKHIESRIELEQCLINIIINLGLCYNSNDEIQKVDIQNIVDKLYFLQH